MKRSLILLSLNEYAAAKKIIPLLPFDAVDEILSIDGGSTDGTIELLRSSNINVVVQKKPGRGAAFQLASQISNGENLVFFSLDGNEDPNDISKLFKRLEEGCDLVIASRMTKDSINEEDVNWIRPRKWVNKILTKIANTLWNKNDYISDTINGFRGITKKSFRSLKIDSDNFTVEFQMSIRAMKMNLHIEEIPTHEKPRIGGLSKAKSVPVGLSMLRELIQEIAIGKNF